jgi:hypothetical protein
VAVATHFCYELGTACSPETDTFHLIIYCAKAVSMSNGTSFFKCEGWCVLYFGQCHSLPAAFSDSADDIVQTINQPMGGGEWMLVPRLYLFIHMQLCQSTLSHWLAERNARVQAGRPLVGFLSINPTVGLSM